MKCFQQKVPTRKEILKARLNRLNDLLRLEKGVHGNMIHVDNAYGGYSVVGYSEGSGDRDKKYTDWSSGAITDISLYYTGRMSINKTIDLLNSMINVIEYANRLKEEEK